MKDSSRRGGECEGHRGLHCRVLWATAEAVGTQSGAGTAWGNGTGAPGRLGLQY